MLVFTAICAPSIIVLKPKFHFLLHIPFFIRRFGPALLYSTERFESFNKVFRLASVHSNRQAPSRDIAGTFADLERVRHIATGGYWLKPTGKPQCAGKGILRMMEKPEYVKLLGIRVEKKNTLGIFFLKLS